MSSCKTEDYISVVSLEKKFLKQFIGFNAFAIKNLGVVGWAAENALRDARAFGTTVKDRTESVPWMQPAITLHLQDCVIPWNLHPEPGSLARVTPPGPSQNLCLWAHSACLLALCECPGHSGQQWACGSRRQVTAGRKDELWPQPDLTSVHSLPLTSSVLLDKRINSFPPKASFL